MRPLLLVSLDIIPHGPRVRLGSVVEINGLLRSTWVFRVEQMDPIKRQVALTPLDPATGEPLRVIG